MDWKKNSSAGCVVTRLVSQESRGTTHVIVSGSAPDCASQTQVSMAVLPPPRTTKRRGVASAVARHRSGRAFGGTRRTPGAAEKLGLCVDGTDGLPYVASTTQRARTVVVAPDSSERKRCSPLTASRS